jgi:hypothetical protein
MRATTGTNHPTSHSDQSDSSPVTTTRTGVSYNVLTTNLATPITTINEENIHWHVINDMPGYMPNSNYYFNSFEGAVESLATDFNASDGESVRTTTFAKDVLVAIEWSDNTTSYIEQCTFDCTEEEDASYAS